MLDQFVVLTRDFDDKGVSIVRKTIIFGGTLMAVSAIGLATDDNRYPAYDFQPSVIVPAPEEGGGVPSKEVGTQRDAKYPAAYFEPTVIIPASEEATKEEAPQPDPRYPAYHFEPKVIYQEK
ncbi:hypothetical protein sS8_1448 [Methylocaldum marinum]|uniref:Uncharacterized protein n=1 Tax=Methylocaldum marinum TaxID=1432792 RepID=A0A250KP82_9GAMM|nr:hypothetical protein [Methylocaldum marinum]BBA33408.1 hypothetical protein sS8_1448 [Methylocaldum marinum]